MTVEAMTRPRYQHIKDRILADIRAGALTPGSRVPSENELTGRFDVSRMTANRALRELTQEGWIRRVPGLGSFVAEPPRRASLIEIRNIAEEIAARGHVHTAREIARREIAAGKALAAEMELEPGTRVFYIRLVHAENGIPVQLEERCVNPAVAPEFLEQDFTRTTPTAYLVATVAADEIEHTVQAILPSPDQARLLGIAGTEPCLSLTRRSWHDGAIVTLATLIYPASRYSLYGRHTRQPQQ